MFSVQEADTTDNSIGCHDTLSYRDMAVGVTVVLGLLMVTLVIVVVWLWRRQWTLPCAGKRGPVGLQVVSALHHLTACPSWEYGLSKFLPPPKKKYFAILIEITMIYHDVMSANDTRRFIPQISLHFIKCKVDENLLSVFRSYLHYSDFI